MEAIARLGDIPDDEGSIMVAAVMDAAAMDNANNPGH